MGTCISFLPFYSAKQRKITKSWNVNLKITLQSWQCCHVSLLLLPVNSFNYRHEYPQWPDKGEDHEGMKGVYCFMVFGICSLFLIYFYETRCCKGEGFSVSIRSYVPNVSIEDHCHDILAYVFDVFDSKILQSNFYLYTQLPGIYNNVLINMPFEVR